MPKLNKRQTAIIQLLNIVESEGLDYAIIHYGVEKQLKQVKDDEFDAYVKQYQKLTKSIEKKLSGLEKEVSFLDPDLVDSVDE